LTFSPTLFNLFSQEGKRKKNHFCEGEKGKVIKSGHKSQPSPISREMKFEKILPSFLLFSETAPTAYSLIFIKSS